MNHVKLFAKASLYQFLQSSSKDLITLHDGKNQLAHELLHYTVQHLFPAFKTADEICIELINVLQLFECPIPPSLRSNVAEAMANKAVGISKKK